MSEQSTAPGNRFLEFAVLVTAVAVLMLAVVELHVRPPTVLADRGTDTAASAAGGHRPVGWTITATSPIDASRRLAPVPTLATGGITSAATRVTRSVVVDRDVVGQRWLGVGGAFTDVAVDLLDADPEALGLLFDPGRSDGAHLDLGRLPLSATDFSTTAWTWAWDARSGVATPTLESRQAVDLVEDAVVMQPDLRLVATPWTAPAGMIAADRGLAADAEADYAELLRQQVSWLVADGAPVHAISLANEPGHSAEYPTLTLTDDQMVRLAHAVRPALDAADVDLWAVDHNWADRDRVDTVIASAEFDAAAFHCYDGAPDEMNGLAIPAIVTECTGTNDSWTSTFGWDSRVLVTGSIRAGATGLLMWNLAQAPGTSTLPGGCDDCRGLLTIDPASGAIERGPEFFTLAHLARAADPGAVQVMTNRIERMPTVAFVNPDDTLGIFGHNDTDEVQVVEIEVSGGERTRFTVGPWEMFSIRH